MNIIGVLGLLACAIVWVTLDIIQTLDEKERRIAKERAEAAYYGEI